MSTPTTVPETSYGGVVNRGTVEVTSSVGPGNSVSFVKDASNGFTATLYDATVKTVKKMWALIDTTTGINSAADFPVFQVDNAGTVTTFGVAAGSTLAANQGALVFFRNVPSSHLFRFLTRRTVSKTLKTDVDDSLEFSGSQIVFSSSAGMTTGVNFNVYAVGFQFEDGTATEIQFVNDNSAEAPNVVRSGIYHVSDLTNKFAEMADLYNEDGVTHFTGRIYDDGNLRTNVEAVFNQIITKVPNVLDTTGTVQIVGQLQVSPTGQPLETISITVSPTLQYLDMLFDQAVTVSGQEFGALNGFARGTDYQGMNVVRESFIESFVKHTEFYFTAVDTTFPTTEVDNFLKEYLKPIRVRARMLSMAALTGTNTVAVAGQTNTLQLKDSDQVWEMYSSLRLRPEYVPFATRISALIELTNYSRYIEQVRVYERTLMIGAEDEIVWTATVQDPFKHGQKFLAVLNSVKGSMDLYIQKMLQVWNMARIHNHLFDSDALQVWNGSTVDDLQLEIYATYGYGLNYTWLLDAAGYMAASPEPTALEPAFIEQNLLDRVMVFLRLDDFAAALRPNLIIDSFEQMGWVAFVDAFTRYYFWSATAATTNEFNAEQSFINNKATFLRAFDESVIQNNSFTTDDHILEGAKAVLTTNVAGVYPEAQAFTTAFSRIRNLNSETFWNDVVLRRLNHLPYHVVWHQTENMLEKTINTTIAQSAATLLAIMSSFVDFYAKTTTADAQANQSVPHVYDWYRTVGYLAAIPQELPADPLMFGSEIGFTATVRSKYAFVNTQTMAPKAFFDEMTRRLFFFHRCDASFAISGSLNSTHDQNNNFNPLIEVLGAFDPNTDVYTTGYRGLKNVNNYYQLLKKENDLRLAISNQDSDFDLEDLVRIFNDAISQLQSQTNSLISTNGVVQSDITTLSNLVATYHDPYSSSGLIDDLQLRYVQVSSENRAQQVLKDTYNAFVGLFTQVKTSSDSVSSLQVTYQSNLNAYNAKFDEYVEIYTQWNNLIDSASGLLESTTSYVDLLQARITLTAQVSQLREKFNSDVALVRSTITAIQQTFINLKSQGIRSLPTSDVGSSVTIGGSIFQRRSATTFPIINLLNFVPK